MDNFFVWKDAGLKKHSCVRPLYIVIPNAETPCLAMPPTPWPCSQDAAQAQNADSFPRFPNPSVRIPKQLHAVQTRAQVSNNILRRKHTSPPRPPKSLRAPAQTIPPRRHRTYPLNLPIGTQPPRRPEPHRVLPKHLLIPQIRLRERLFPGIRAVRTTPVRVLLRLGPGGPPAARRARGSRGGT